jgi:hypothetical protein
MSWQTAQAIDLGSMTFSEVIDTWQRFSSVLMLDDRELFQRMISDLNVEAIEQLGLGIRDFELLAMTLIFQQQKMIAWLLDVIEKRKDDCS